MVLHVCSYFLTNFNLCTIITIVQWNPSQTDTTIELVLSIKWGFTVTIKINFGLYYIIII